MEQDNRPSGVAGHLVVLLQAVVQYACELVKLTQMLFAPQSADDWHGLPMFPGYCGVPVQADVSSLQLLHLSVPPLNPWV
jgi:hypothetical protein